MRERFLTPRGLSAARGARQIEHLPQPAPGAEWSWTVPSGYFWRIISVFTELTTSVAVANRFPHTQILDPDGKPLAKLVSDHVVAASLTVPVTTFIEFEVAGLPEAAALLNSFPNVILEAGYIVRSFTPNLQPADQYSAPTLWLEQFEDRGDVYSESEEHIELLIRLLQGAN